MFSYAEMLPKVGGCTGDIYTVGPAGEGLFHQQLLFMSNPAGAQKLSACQCYMTLTVQL